MKPYALFSDAHFHNWSAFSQINEMGINSRLQIQLDELRYCADTLKSLGGNLIVNAGDTFHLRNQIVPSVMNPVRDLHHKLISEGFIFSVIPGNHDTANKDADRLSSSSTVLEDAGCDVHSVPSYSKDRPKIIFVPWIQDISKLKEIIECVPYPEVHDLVIHAPIDGVIKGLPNHGLDGEYLASLGFKRVFAGHYHDHKEVVLDKVWSVGATTHQTWSDIGTKAGFVIVSDDGVKHYESHAPKFIDISDLENFDELPLIIDGNYIRIKINVSKPSEIDEMRQTLLSNGALGVLIVPTIKDALSARGNSSVSKSASLDESIIQYVKDRGFNESVELACADILQKVRSV